jgi:AraC-like DNA-binding protein
LIEDEAFRRLLRSRDFLAARSDQRVVLAEPAAEAGFSAYHYHRLFQRAFGETPLDFLTRLRMDRAKSLLAQGDLPVTEICFEVGYESLGSFSARFKEVTGWSPSAYRRRVRSQIAVPVRWIPRFFPGCFLRAYAGGS